MSVVYKILYICKHFVKHVNVNRYNKLRVVFVLFLLHSLLLLLLLLPLACHCFALQFAISLFKFECTQSNVPHKRMEKWMFKTCITIFVIISFYRPVHVFICLDIIHALNTLRQWERERCGIRLQFEIDHNLSLNDQWYILYCFIF